MGYQDAENTKGERGSAGYQFEKLPENIRQIGELPEKDRIYIEDYVVTYMHQIFAKKRENAVVVLLGKKGQKEAEDALFVYGAIEVELELLSGSQSFNAETWDKIYEVMYEHFQGAEVLGWGLGVSMWNSQIDGIVRQIQEKHFAKEGRILFLEDLSEREEKVFCWRGNKLTQIQGYIIYYEKNPQMQDYMLLGQPKKSFESSYEDKVTATVRNVVHRNTEQASPKKIAFYSAGVFLALLTVLGANLLVQSTKKIDNLEKTIETLSNAATNVTETPKKADKEMDGQKKKKTDKQNVTVTEKGADKRDKKVQPENTVKPQKTGTDSKIEPLVPASAMPKAAVNPSALLADIPSKEVRSTKTPKTTPKNSGTPKTNIKTNGTPEPDRKTVHAIKRSASSYVVQSGDTLSQIVWRHYHTLSCMKMVQKANDIKNGDEIKEGQKLYLPAYSR